MKSIESPVARLLADVIVDELTVNELPGFCITPFKELDKNLIIE